MNRIFKITTLVVFILGGVAVIGRPQRNVGEEENKLRFLYFPTVDEQVEIIYNDSHSIQASNIKQGAKTILLVDGFTAPPVTPMTWETKNIYTGRADVNVIIVDWSAYSGFGHPIATPEDFIELYAQVFYKEIPKAAEDLADFIDFMAKEMDIDHDNITLIGHSLGCHTVGYTGRTSITKYGTPVGRIVALDIAAQLSEYDAPLRLRRGDASVVEVYNTNRNLAGDAFHAVGDIAIFVNGGDNQPCQFLPTGKAEDIGLMCDSHGFSWKFYNYLINNATIKACPCSGAACLCQGCGRECGDDGISIGPHTPEEARGTYHVKTGFLDWGF